MAILTSDTEFNILRRVQETNEVPLLSLWEALHSGLKSDFWRYLIGTSSTEYDTSAFAKSVNGVASTSSYGPDSGSYHSLEIDGVIAPEVDLFLHEIYRYMDPLYPDHPDWDKLLTTLEINEAFSAVAAIINYIPNYKFLGPWSSSFTGSSQTQEELKWKIRDLLSYAFRRKFAGSYLGYKMIFSSMYRHGSIYLTGTYLPRLPSGAINAEDPNAYRFFRLIDYEGENESTFVKTSTSSFRGIIDPSDLYTLYSPIDHPAYMDDESYRGLMRGAFLYENAGNNNLYAPGLMPSVFIETVGNSIPSNGDGLYVTAYAKTSNVMHTPTTGAYSWFRGLLELSSSLALTPSPKKFGYFSLPLSLAPSFYSSTIINPYAALEATDTSYPWDGTSNFNVGDLIKDVYLNEESAVTYDISTITEINRGYIQLSIDPSARTGNITYSNNPISIIRVKVGEDAYVDIQGKLVLVSSGTSLLAKFYIASILGTSEVIPLVATGNEDLNNNRVTLIDSITLRNRMAVGQGVELHQFITYSGLGNEKWSKVLPSLGWVQSIDFGGVTVEATHIDGQALEAQTPYTAETFAPAKSRVAKTFKADNLSAEVVDFYGTVSASDPYKISFLYNLSAISVDDLSVGGMIRGPGIQSATVISNINEDTVSLSLPATLFGTFKYSSITKSGSKDSSMVLAYKSELHSKFPLDASNIFSMVWPGRLWPSVSLGYLEGFKDISLYHYITGATLPSGVIELTEIAFTKDIVLELSLDQCLYHPNTLNKKSGTSYMCLCDLPWLNYIESQIEKLKRSTEAIRVGAQLNLVTDTSGFYSSGTLGYTDPEVRSKFTVFPPIYYGDEENPDPDTWTPAYVQVGTAGENKQSYFKSAADLVRPVLYGESTQYDGQRVPLILNENETVAEAMERTPLQDGEAFLFPGEKRRNTYATSEYLLEPLEEGAAITSAGLENPIFESPVGEWENPHNVAPAAAPDNAYQLINVSIYPQEYAGIKTELTNGNRLIINSPALVDIKKIPEGTAGWHHKGEWSPKAKFGFPTTPDYPTGTFSNKDYFIIRETGRIGTNDFYADDWLYYDNGTWKIKYWLFQNFWADSVLPTAANLASQEGLTSLTEIMTKGFPYFIVSGADRTIGSFNVSAGDWLIATEYSGANITSWAHSPGEAYINCSADTIRTRRIKYWTYAGTIAGSTTPVSPPMSNLIEELPYYVVTGSSRLLTMNGVETSVNHGDWVYVIRNDNGTPVWSKTPASSEIISHLVHANEPVFWRFQKEWNGSSFPAVNDCIFDDTGGIPHITQVDQWLYEGYPYFIITGADRTITFSDGTRFDVTAGDWIIPTARYNDKLTKWKLATKSSILPLPWAYISWTISSADFSAFNNQKIANIDISQTKYTLPRRFVTTGSTNFIYQLDPKFTVLDDQGATRDLTSGPIYADEDNKKLYIKNNDVRYNLDLQESVYFKNLTSLVGEAEAGSTGKDIVAVDDTGIPFNNTYVSLGDEVYSVQEAKIRQAYDANNETQFFSHYLETYAMPDPNDRTKLIPATTASASLSSDYRSKFLSAMSGVSAGHLVKDGQAADARVFDIAHENKYFKNLLIVAGTVDKSDSSVLYPLDETAEGIDAFSSALQKLSIGDSIYEIYSLAGLLTTSTEDVMTSGAILALASANDIVLAGNSAGELKKRVQGAWQTISISGWGANAVRAITYANGIWFVAGDNGKLARSLDNAETWVSITIPSWGTAAINALAYAVDTWVAVGNNGQLAYSTDSVNYFNSWSLGTLPVASGEDLGWETDPVYSVAYGNGLWIVSGGTDTALIAKASSPNNSWTFVSLPELWGSEVSVRGVSFAKDTWVAVGNRGKVAYSTDGALTWALGSMPGDWNDADANKLRYINGEWYILGTSGKFARSSDGSIWTVLPETALESVAIFDIARLDTNYFIAGNNIKVAVTTDTFNSSISNINVSSVDGMRIVFNAALVDEASWEEVETTKTVLISVDTRKSIDNELLGLPANSYDRFISSEDNTPFVAPYIGAASFTTANRVCFPRMMPGHSLADDQGYPTYTEVPELYTSDSFINFSKDYIYVCDDSGRYLDNQFVVLSSKDFLAYRAYSETGVPLDNPIRVDERFIPPTPLYPKYEDWATLSAVAAMTLIEGEILSTATVDSVGTTEDPFIKLSSAVAGGIEFVYVRFLPAASSAGVATPQYAWTDVANDGESYAGFLVDQNNAKTSHVDNGRTYYQLTSSEITGIYFPPQGYGAVLGVNTSTTGGTYPWEVSSYDFESSIYLQNSKGEDIYLCKADGTFVLDSGNKIRAKAPTYVSFELLIANEGRLKLIGSETLEVKGSRNKVSARGSSQGDDQISVVTGLTPPTSGRKFYNIKILTTQVSVPAEEVLNDSSLIYTMSLEELDKFSPDRICVKAGYPTWTDNPDLYKDSDLTTRSGAYVYACDLSGNYLSETNEITTTAFYRMRAQRYLTCFDWYVDTIHDKNNPGNPFWQYLILKDQFDPSNKTWSQVANFYRQRKKNGVLVFEQIDEEIQYFLVRPNLGYELNNEAFRVSPTNYIDHQNGAIGGLLYANNYYNKVVHPNVDSDLKNFGIAPISHFNDVGVDLFSDDEIARTSDLFNTALISSFAVNSLKNYADPLDKVSSIVGVTELGVFNRLGQMIAYANFPAIIYDSARNHISFNIAIKHGSFT